MDLLTREELPSSFDERSGDMKSVLRLALENLLETAKKDNITIPPYGRKPEAKPIMTEEEFMAQKDDPDDEAHFSFDYGFNPLRHMATFIKRFHPDSVISRRKAREACMEQLHRRALHAQRQETASADLITLAQKKTSGLNYGPVILAVTSSEVSVLCQAFKEGDVVTEVSADPTFPDDSTTFVQVETATPDKNFVVQYSFPELNAETKYYVRSCLREMEYQEVYPDELPFEPELELEKSEDELKLDGEHVEKRKSEVIFKGRDSGNFTSCTFWSLLSTEAEDLPKAKKEMESEELPFEGEEENAESPVVETGGEGDVEAKEIGEGNEDGKTTTEKPPEEVFVGPKPVTLIGVNLTPPSNHIFFGDAPEIIGPRTSLEVITKEENAPAYTCLLGDIYPTAQGQDGHHHKFFEDNNTKFQLLNTMLAADSMFNQTSMFFGWNDTQTGSDVALQAEEIVHKQFSHDLRHWTRKYKDNGDKKKSSRKKKDHKEPPPEPVLNRPPISAALSSITRALPLKIEEDSARRIYNSFFVGRLVQVFSLDMRRGFLGKQQSRWLRSGLETSPAPWKIILCGVPFGMVNVPGGSSRPVTSEGKVTVTNEEEGQFGFPNVSLEHVLCKVQDLIIRPPESEDQENLPEQEPVATSNTEQVVEVTSEAEIEIAVEATTEKFDKKELSISSGVVLMSGGPSQSFMSLYDPLESGTPCMLEVCGGSALRFQQQPGVTVTIEPEPVVMKERLGANLLYSGGGSKPSLSTVKILVNGNLEISIIDAISGDILYTKELVKPLEADKI